MYSLIYGWHLIFAKHILILDQRALGCFYNPDTASDLSLKLQKKETKLVKISVDSRKL